MTKNSLENTNKPTRSQSIGGLINLQPGKSFVEMFDGKWD